MTRTRVIPEYSSGIQGNHMKQFNLKNNWKPWIPAGVYPRYSPGAGMTARMLSGFATAKPAPYLSSPLSLRGYSRGNPSLVFSGLLRLVRATPAALGVLAMTAMMSLIGLIGHIPEAKASGLIKPANNLGLVGYWSFEDATGTKATDFSGNGNTGILSGIADWTGGKFGKGLSFDGSDGYVEIAENIVSSNVMSISVWVNPGVLNIYQSILSIFTANDDAMEIQMLNSGDGRVFGGGYSSGAISANSTIPLNTWTHVVLTSNGTNLQFYINGVANGAAGTTQFSTFNKKLYFGGREGNGYTFTGKIDDIRIFNRTLSAGEVLTLYNSGGVAKTNSSLNNFMTDGLVGLWSFDGADISGTNAYDRSGQGNNGTLLNGPTQEFGKIGQALNFDGYDDSISIPFSQTIASNFTISAWAQVNATSGQDLAIVGSRGGSDKSFDMKLSYFGGFHIHGDIGNGTSWISTGADANFDWRVKTWYHIVYVVTTTTYKIYANGAQVGSGSFATDTPLLVDATHPLAIGKYVDINSNNPVYEPFNGTVDEVRIYNRALSADEVQKLYRAGTTTVNKSVSGISNGLVAWHTFDGNKLNSTTSTDSSGQGNHGTLVGSTVPEFGKIGQAINLPGDADGVGDYVNIPQTTNLDGFSAMTVALWFKQTGTDASGYNPIIDSNQGENYPAYNVTLEGAGPQVNISLRMKDANGTQIDKVVYGQSVAGSIWHYLVLTYDGEDAALSIDGTTHITASELSGPLIDQASPIEVGAHDVSAWYFRGAIDDLRIYNRALSATEISQLYNMGR